ncbi:MAG: hypothetical protein QOG79_544 [Mycobacterium sp.]|nr:hypothetical protein [Mycobacterium sp.]
MRDNAVTVQVDAETAAVTSRWTRPVGVKVSDVTPSFWVLKLLTTALGEAASDYLLGAYRGVGLAVGVIGFAVALTLQLRATRYHPAVYWATVAMVAVAGTMAADLVHGELGVPLAASTIACALGVALTFWVWHRVEGTLSVHSIDTRRREVFYWLAVSFTFALGTAAGDLTADQVGLGFLGSIVLFAVVIALPAVGYWKLGLGNVVAFWWAYIATRPLGASVADWLGKPASHGGLGYGDGVVALMLLVVAVGLVGVVTFRPQSSRRGSGPRAVPTGAASESLCSGQ